MTDIEKKLSPGQLVTIKKTTCTDQEWRKQFVGKKVMVRSVWTDWAEDGTTRIELFSIHGTPEGYEWAVEDCYCG